MTLQGKLAYQLSVVLLAGNRAASTDMYSMESDSKLKMIRRNMEPMCRLQFWKHPKRRRLSAFALALSGLSFSIFALALGNGVNSTSHMESQQNAQPAFELLPLLPFPQCLDFWEIRRLRWTGSALLKSGCSILLQIMAKIHLKPPRNSRLIVQMRMFHYVTRFSKFGTHSHQRKTPMSIHRRNLATSAPPLLPKHLCCEQQHGHTNDPHFLASAMFNTFAYFFTRTQKVFHQLVIQFWNDGLGVPIRTPFSTNSTTLPQVLHTFIPSFTPYCSNAS